MELDLPSTVEDFEDALRRLGWLSAYSRQILMARHLLRNFSAISHPDDVPNAVSGDFALNLFRCAITVLCGANKNIKKFSSPYEPLDRPETNYSHIIESSEFSVLRSLAGSQKFNFILGTVAVSVLRTLLMCQPKIVY